MSEPHTVTVTDSDIDRCGKVEVDEGSCHGGMVTVLESIASSNEVSRLRPSATLRRRK